MNHFQNTMLITGATWSQLPGDELWFNSIWQTLIFNKTIKCKTPYQALCKLQDEKNISTFKGLFEVEVREQENISTN